MIDFNKEIAILIIGYQRPEKVKRLIEMCLKFSPRKIYLAIDGPKNEFEKVKTDELERISLELFRNSNQGFRIWKREENLGLGVSVISAIDWCFQTESHLIILEDDVLPNESFFGFVSNNINLLDQNEQILMISGTNLFNEKDKSEIYACNYPLIWGWATNKVKWQEIKHGILFSTCQPNNNRSKKVMNYWKVGAARVRKGLVDTWDTPLAEYMVKMNKICIYPTVNLVKNIGYDAYATNTKTFSILLNQDTHNFNGFISSEMVTHPEEIDLENRKYEMNVFKIRYKHRFLPIFSKLTDWFIFRNRKPPLLERMSSVKYPTKSSND